MKKILLAILFLAVVPSLQARTAAFRIWVNQPLDTLHWKLYDSSAVAQSGSGTIDSSGYFVWWNLTYDDTTSYTLEAKFIRNGSQPVSACITLQLVYTSAVDSLRYGMWLGQPADTVRWTLRSATAVAYSGKATLDSSDYYAYWTMPVDSANRYLLTVDFTWDGATRRVSDIEDLQPFGSGSGGAVTLTDSSSFIRWVQIAISGIGHTYRVNLLDTSAAPDAVIPGVTVQANNLNQSSFNWTARTDIYGNAYFGLDTGTYIIYTTNPAYWPNIDTIVVSDTGSYVFRQRAAVSTNLASFTTPVSFSLTKPDASPNDSARINIELVSLNDSLLRINNIIVAASYRQMLVRSDANGLCVVGLFPNAYFSNDTSYYRVTIRNKVGETIVEEYLTRIPISDTTQAAALLPRWEEE
jgi:hypothetical protein